MSNLTEKMWEEIDNLKGGANRAGAQLDSALDLIGDELSKDEDEQDLRAILLSVRTRIKRAQGEFEDASKS